MNKVTRRTVYALVAVALAIPLMGEDSCSTDSGSNNDTGIDKHGGAGGGSGGGTSAASKPAAKPAKEEPELTAGQENALRSAQDYLDLSGFSKAGLIEQLSSSAGEGFSKADATFAANHVDVDWNAEAVESAKDYLDLSGFSKSALIEQLSSSAGEQFTPAQAQYAANKVYGSG